MNTFEVREGFGCLEVGEEMTMKVRVKFTLHSTCDIIEVIKI